MTINNDILTYRVGIYIRLSREDIDKQIESVSVTNQRNVLLSYIKDNNYELYDIYIDDGYTGTNFDRPAFKRLINDIENGMVNMVVTKDLSRLGRDYIATGEYIEKYFPLHNVRYVSLLDGIDTLVDNSNNDIAPFKAVINDMYSRDNSKKIRTAFKTMQLKGKWVGGCRPFGYMVDPSDKNHLIVNNQEAEIVRTIFKYAKAGMNYYQIAQKLTYDKVPTFSMLRNTFGRRKMALLGIWSPKTIRGILSNEIYLGNMVQNKNNRVSYKVRKNVLNQKDKWIIVLNTHEALIDKDTFLDIQRLNSNSVVRSKKKIYRSLDGLLYCNECGSRITICSPNKKGYTYIVCNAYRMYSKQHLCTSHCFNYDKLEQIIFNKIKEIFKKLKYSIVLENFNNSSNLDSKIKLNEINSMINAKEIQLDKMYLDKLDGKISEEMYERINKELTADIDKLKMNRINNNRNEYIKTIKRVLNLEDVSRTIMLFLIKKIIIHDDKTIDIYLNFKDCING